MALLRVGGTEEQQEHRRTGTGGAAMVIAAAAESRPTECSALERSREESRARAWQAELRAASVNEPRSFVRGEMPRRHGRRGATEAALRLGRTVSGY